MARFTSQRPGSMAKNTDTSNTTGVTANVSTKATTSMENVMGGGKTIGTTPEKNTKATTTWDKRLGTTPT